MTNTSKLAEMKRRKTALEAQIKAIKESKTVSESKSRTGLAYLIESELEKAEVVLAAKSVVDKLQKMAEDLAKINGDEIMPLMEPLKTAFGPQMAGAFQTLVNEKVTATVTAVTQAKDAISAEVGKFQGIIDGTGTGSDMAGMGADEMGLGGDAPMTDMAAPANDEPAMGDDLGGMEMDAEIDAIDGDPMSDDGAFDTDPLAGEPVGRAKKESAAPKGKRIAETKKGETDSARQMKSLGKEGSKKYAQARGDLSDHATAYDAAKKHGAKYGEQVSESDRAILTVFKKLIREGVQPVRAARRIAEKMSIDYSDVVEIIRESGLGK